MRTSFIILTFFLTHFSFAQSEFNHWYSAGIKGEVVKKLDWSAELDFRFDTYGLATFFPEVGLEYKLTDWLKSSVDYRFISSRNSVGNFNPSNRINLNLTAKEKLMKRFYGSLRLRYQFGFNTRNEEYDSEFDQAIRVKPKFEYDLKNFPLTPSVGTEFFFNTAGGDIFSKMRSEFGFEYEGLGDHSIGIKYMWEYKPHSSWFKHRHIIALSYSYELK